MLVSLNFFLNILRSMSTLLIGYVICILSDLICLVAEEAIMSMVSSVNCWGSIYWSCVCRIFINYDSIGFSLCKYSAATRPNVIKRQYYIRETITLTSNSIIHTIDWLLTNFSERLKIEININSDKERHDKQERIYFW